MHEAGIFKHRERRVHAQQGEHNGLETAQIATVPPVSSTLASNPQSRAVCKLVLTEQRQL